MQTQSDIHQTTPTYYEPASPQEALDQHKLRVLIDELAQTRGLTIQMSLRATMIVATEDEDAQKAAAEEFLEMAAQFDRILEMVFGSSPIDGIPLERLSWLRRIASKNNSREARMRDVQRAVASLSQRLSEGELPSYDQVRHFYVDNFPVVRDDMTAIIWDLWADLDAQRDDAVQGMKTLSETLSSTLGDIKRISMTVRMISLNAAVLASRAGEKGAGFSVIATEVRSLAEKIQSSANRANNVLKEMDFRR